MRLRPVEASLILILCSALGVCAGKVQGQAKTPDPPKPEITQDGNRKNTGPVVEAWEPKTASIDSLIYLSGYRLYPGGSNKSKAFFIQNGVELPVSNRGGSFITNNVHDGPQTLCVIVPEEVVPGQAQIVVEFDGRRSVPATVTITEWKLPIIKGVNPTRGAPGAIVEIECEGFHVTDELEITDAEGKPLRVGGGGSSKGTAFGIPEDAPLGVITIRIGNRKYGKGQYTEPVTFTITNEPLPVELWPAEMKSVAPGQWLDLQVSNAEPLKQSELTEVAFRQAGRTIIVATPKPFLPHVEVPSALSAGEVQMQVRTWRDGRPSQWSELADFELASKPLAPLIDSIRLVKGSWAALLPPGPDRVTSFTVSPSDEVVLHGLWPVADASKLKVMLVRPGEAITLTATNFDEKANWFGDVQVRLPESLEVGDWRMIVSSEADGTQNELPIVIRVVKK
jgi:hypothetical protein